MNIHYTKGYEYASHNKRLLIKPIQNVMNMYDNISIEVENLLKFLVPPLYTIL